MLTACGNGSGQRRGTTLITVPGASTELPRKIIFAVDSAADKNILSAAEAFCDKANSLSNGSFMLTLEKSGNQISDLRSGGAGLALIDTKKAAAIHDFFAVAGERFSYNSYENFSITCNSPEILGQLSDVSSMRVFAAYYTGSNMLVSPAKVEDMLAGNLEAGDEEFHVEPAACVIPETGAASPLELLGISAKEEAALSQRVHELSANGAIIELSALEVENAKLAEAVLSEGDYAFESLYLIRTFHNIDPLWLILAPSLYESFTPLEKAAFDEAAACMAGDIDAVYLAREQQAAAFADEDGILVSDEFNAIRTKIKRARDEARGAVSDEEKRFRELLTQLS